jgi:cobalt/nickel transport system permease protein
MPAMNAIDVIAHTNAWTTRHPGEKVLLGGSLLVLSVILPPWPAALLVIVSVLAAATLGAGIPAAAFLRVLALPLAFLLSGAAMLAVTLDLDAPGPAIGISAESLEAAALVSLRALAATSATMLIVLTTPLPALIHLARRLRLPEPLIELCFLIYRFTGLTIALATTARQAQRNRLGHATFRISLRSTGLLAARLLPQTLVHAERLQAGLAARGYDGSLRTLAPEWRRSPRFVAGAAGLAAGIVLATCLWPGPWR